ncbi:cation diffusion facilitator family transporter [Microgenomates group bacterium]|nr:cation diffusion facilitator family transporter [Microgenomates group bacterium]
MKKTATQIAIKASITTIISDAALSLLKLLTGIFARSSALISDSIHTLSDVLSTVIVIIGVKLAARGPDKEHPYGHERFECVAAIILATILFMTGAGIGWTAIQNVSTTPSIDLTIPELPALIVAIVSIIVKESMYWYKRSAAKKTNSSALMADAWHHRSDALSSIGSFAGILGARLGFPILDPLAGLVICLFILKVALDIFKDAIGKMTDRSAPKKLEVQIRQLILSHKSVVSIDLLKTRLFADRVYVDVEISIDGTKTLDQAHAVAKKVHDAIENKIPQVKHCNIHTNPAPSKTNT